MAQKNIMDTKPELRYLPITQLYIPHKYQRALEGAASLRNIERIITGFNWAEHGTILVSKTKSNDERFAVIDGQHRVRAAEMRGDIEELPCVIISPRQVKEQAQTFININSKRAPLSPFQLHRASLVAGDEVSIELQRICDEAGVTIPHYSGLSHMISPETFQAIGRVRALIESEAHTSEDIIAALKLLRSALPKQNGALRFNIVRAVLAWIEKYPDSGKDNLKRALRSLNLDNLDLDARKVRLGGADTLWKAYLVVIEREVLTLKKQAA